MEPFPQVSRGDVVRRWELCTGELTMQVIWPPLAIHLMEKNDDQAIVSTIRNRALPDIIFA
jgi:hypothetical protein